MRWCGGLFLMSGHFVYIFFPFFPSHEAVALWHDLLTRGRVLLDMYKRKHEALAEKRES